MTHQLSQQLSFNLEEHSDKIGSMFMEGHGIDSIREHLLLSEAEMQDMTQIMFNLYPYYTVKDIDGNEKFMRFNAHTLQSKEVKDEY